MLCIAAFVALLAFPVRANVRVEPHRDSTRGALSGIPSAWHDAIARFLDSEIDEAVLYSRLLTLSQPLRRIENASARSPDLDLAGRADLAMTPEDRFTVAGRFIKLESVLAAFIPEDHLVGLKQEAERLVPQQRRRELMETARITAELLAGMRPDGGHLPAAGDFATDDASMDIRAEIDIGYIRESLSHMKYDPSGAIFFNEDDGFPDELSYSVAHKAASLLRDDPDGRWVKGDDRILLERLSTVFRLTEDIIFSKGNELAKTVRYMEPRAGGLNMTILRYVETGQYAQGPFWVSSNERTLEAPEGYADVDAQSAKGPFLAALKLEEFIEKMGRQPASPKELTDFKSKARSRFFWAAMPGAFGIPDVNGMRVRVNSDWKGNDRTLEVLAPVGNYDDGELRWKGFFFKKIESRWVSGAPAKLNPASKCIKCHFLVDVDGKPRHTPLPHGKLKTREDYLQAGYKDTRLLDRYRAIGHRALEDDGDLSLPAPTR